MYDQVGCRIFGKVKRFGISIALPGGRWTSLAFWSLHMEAQPRVTSLLSGMGGSGVDRSFVVIDDDPKPPLLGLTSP